MTQARPSLLLLATACALWLGLACPAAFAQQPTSAPSPGEVSRISQEINDEIYSPFCPGKTLDMCPSPNAAEVRREIQSLAAQGQAKDQIKAKILQTYGEEFRIVEPPAQDNAMLLIAIILGLIFALALVRVLSTRRAGASGDAAALGGPQASTQEPHSAEDAEYLDRLRQELDA